MFFIGTTPNGFGNNFFHVILVCLNEKHRFLMKFIFILLVLMPSIEQASSYLPYSYSIAAAAAAISTTPTPVTNSNNFNVQSTNFNAYTLAAANQLIMTSPPHRQQQQKQQHHQQQQQSQFFFQSLAQESQPIQANFHPFNSSSSSSNTKSNNNRSEAYYPNMIRSKRSGHVSKSRVLVKRSAVDQINLQKSCPNCSRYWRNCKCSNIKNRPDPKPYCKFVPPRMLRKQMVNSNDHEN